MNRRSILYKILQVALMVAAGALAGPAGGPLRAEENPGATPLTREYLLAELKREVVAHYNLEGDLQLDLLRPWTPPARVARTWKITVMEFPAIASATLLLRGRVQAESAAADDFTLVLRAALWRDAWVTRQPVTAQTIFDPGLLETRRVDLLRERDALPAAVGDGSFVFSRGVPAGRVLTWRDIAARPLVRKGELVEVSAGDGQILVTMKALAMENGARGDRVTVRNPESRKDFTAVVTHENQVEVRF